VDAKAAITQVVEDAVKETRDRINRVVAEAPEDILAIVRAETAQIFDREGIPPWPRLTIPTIEKRLRGRSKRQVRVGKILHRTGVLRSSVIGGFYVERPANSVNVFIRFNPDAHRFFTTHHFGKHISGRTRNKDGTYTPWQATIPSRPMLPLRREHQRVGRRIYNEVLIPRLNQPVRGR